MPKNPSDSVRRRRLLRIVLPLVVLVALVGAGAAWAFQQLPAGAQVNNDPGAGINPALSVSGEDPTNADVAGGSLVAGNRAVPWAIFRQQETSPAADQIFSRSFAANAWTTRGAGTVGGNSSASPTFKGSLNFDQGQAGEAPAIDFAGGGRTVPWATWYENRPGQAFGKNSVFASRFDNTGDANQGKWIFGGQDRGFINGTIEVPSLNINVKQSAENPSVAGGSAVDPTKPGPWITWQETDTAPKNGVDQIFTVRPIGPASANCDGVKPAGALVGGHVPAIGGFCWQQTGIPRVGTGGADPSMNVDPTRNGIEPDIAFTGANDSVPWVVWYEVGATGLQGLHTNEMVFAAKGISDQVANGGFHWVAVGKTGSGTLDTTGANGFGACAATVSNEAGCSLNKNPAADGEDPRVAAGTMTAGQPTAPWVAWDEQVGKFTRIFVSRLVGGATGHFVIANGGNPISADNVNATRPDITFTRTKPFVTWRQPSLTGGSDHVFVGHFINPSSPTFVLDGSSVALTPSAQADVREPISAGCTGNPFNSDGAACQGGTTTNGTPFFLSTNGTSPRSLFANAYRPTGPVTNSASSVTSSGATLNGSINPVGASVRVFFQFGTTTAYGTSTPASNSGVFNVSTPFSHAVTGLASGTTYHFRAVAQSDFGSFFGADKTFTTS